MRPVQGIVFGVVAVVSLVLTVVSVATVAWIHRVPPEENNVNNITLLSVGLWRVCSPDGCQTDDSFSHMATQILSVISTVAHALAALLHMIKHCKKSKHPAHYIIAIMFGIAAFTLLAALATYTSSFHPLAEGHSFGYSYIIGWISLCASIVLTASAIYDAVDEAEKDCKDDCPCCF